MSEPLDHQRYKLLGIWQSWSAAIQLTKDKSPSAIPPLVSDSTVPFVQRLLAAVVCPIQHFDLLNAEVSRSLDLSLAETIAFDCSRTDRMVTLAAALLKRLPPTCQQLNICPWPCTAAGRKNLQHYVEPGMLKELKLIDSSPETLWGLLRVVNQLDMVTLKVALLVTCSPQQLEVVKSIQSFLNFIAKSFRHLRILSKSATKEDDYLRFNIVAAYIWSTWSRCMLLLDWAVLRHHIKYGVTKKWSLTLDSMEATSFLHVSSSPHQNCSYMCGWAFTLLRASRALLSTDFRLLHQRFAELHKQKGGRCFSDSERACRGDHPLNCGRFQDTRLVAAEQSAHVHYQGVCDRLIGVTSNYLALPRPVAISLSYKDNKAQYTKLSNKTLAITHVWSHGHGGRPQTGINLCLHERFSCIAAALDCNSYWIDSLCIPEDHKLRREAIDFINLSFAKSRAVLVLDRDMMEIDISAPTIELLESVLITFLVCDWNSRAWTMLEAIKGRSNIQLLCKNDQVLSLKAAVDIVHRHGRLEIVSLLRALQHLLPSAEALYTVEVAAHLLSHRHATREGDDVVIWSLLSQNIAFPTAEAMWKSLIGSTIKAGFLMSGAPRLEAIDGLSWAPSTPYLRPSVRDSNGLSNSDVFLVHDGTGSQEVLIKAGGLRGTWLVAHFGHDRYSQSRQSHVQPRTMQSEHSRLEGGHTSEIENRCLASAKYLSKKHRFVVLIQPIYHTGSGLLRISSSQYDYFKETFAICVSEDKVRWKWHGVKDWPQDTPVPDMEPEDLFIS